MSNRVGRQEWNDWNVGGESGAGSYDRHVLGPHTVAEAIKLQNKMLCHLLANSKSFITTCSFTCFLSTTDVIVLNIHTELLAPLAANIYNL